MALAVRRVGRLACGPLVLIALTAGAEGPSEYEVKAAFIYKFSKFIEWPEASLSNQDEFKICVLGSAPFGSLLQQTVSGKQINGKPMTVQETTSIAEATTCRICFIGESERGRLDEILRRLGNLPILTVSDLDSFAERGGTIGLIIDRKRVRFEVNMLAARQANLRLSSQLLKVASQVIGRPEEGH